MVSRAEERTRVISVVEAIKTIDDAREAIWDNPPQEVLNLSKGIVPMGTGAKNNYLATFIFAENELRTLTDEILWFAWQTATRNPDIDLKTLVLYMDEICQYKANMNDYVGLPDACEILKVYVGGIRIAKTTQEFADLTESAMTYFNRLHGWVDIAFPWGLVDGFKRINPIEKIANQAHDHNQANGQ
jgi:hypothetical protein